MIKGLGRFLSTDVDLCLTTDSKYKFKFKFKCFIGVTMQGLQV